MMPRTIQTKQQVRENIQKAIQKALCYIFIQMLSLNAHMRSYL